MFLTKTQNLRLKIPRLSEFTDKIEILSTHNLLYPTFAAVCRKIATF